MALVVGDEVALVRSTSSVFSARGNVLFGLVILASGGPPATTVTVAWENGQSTAAVTVAQLDKIAGANQSQTVYTWTDSTGSVGSPEYQGVVVRAYTRQTNGAGTATGYVLLRCLSTGQLYEVLESVLQAVTGL